jgi:hypothetical protein
MRPRRGMEIATLGSSSWMPCAPQGVKKLDDDDDDIQKTGTNSFLLSVHTYFKRWTSKGLAQRPI